MGTTAATIPPGSSEGQGSGRTRSADAATDPADGPHQPSLLEEVFAEHGPQPELPRFANPAEVLASRPRTVRTFQAEHGYPLAKFAVLYPMHAPPAPGGAAAQPPSSPSSTLDLPDAIGPSLEEKGILWRWASEGDIC